MVLMKHKRTLFQELKKGIKEIEAHRVGKITLRTYAHKAKPCPKINADFIRDTREQLNMSQAVFALKLHIARKTLEKWEQGLSKPNDQASILISMVKKYPDMLERIDRI